MVTRITALMLWVMAAGIALAQPAVHSPIDKRVLAFYYPWYGTPDGPGGKGAWVHWEGVDPDKQQIACSTNYPPSGAYDSHDPTVIKRHCEQAREAGIDGFIVSWWGKGLFEDRAMPLLLDAARDAGLTICIYYEELARPRTAESCEAELLEIAKRYGVHPAYQKVNNRPVIFVYGRALDQLGKPGWKQVVERLNAGKDDASCPLLIADRVDAESARLFGGTHVYGPAGDVAYRKNETIEQWADRAFAWWVGVPRKEGKIACVTVFPGYDDRKIRKPGLFVARTTPEGKDLYTTLWTRALAAKPDWVLITSWNEWHEGSEIEPSVENGDASLKATREFADRFKAAPKSP